MLRLVVDPDGQIWPDLLQKAPGRGIYICMDQLCMARTNDKRLRALQGDFQVRLPQWERLQERMQMAFEEQLVRMFARQRASAAIGRDAVMHRLWNNAPLLLLRAVDAGAALARQIDDGLEKRAQAGSKARVALVPSRDLLGRMCGRDEVAVAAISVTGVGAAMAERIERYCAWLAGVDKPAS